MQAVDQFGVRARYHLCTSCTSSTEDSAQDKGAREAAWLRGSVYAMTVLRAFMEDLEESGDLQRRIGEEAVEAERIHTEREAAAADWKPETEAERALRDLDNALRT